MSKTTDYKVQWTPELREAVDNRIIEYLQQGYSQQEAEEKALQDQVAHTNFIFPEVTVSAQAPVQKQVAVESDWDPEYTKFMSAPEKKVINYNPTRASYIKGLDRYGYNNLGNLAARALAFPAAAISGAHLVGQAAPYIPEIYQTVKWGLTTPAGQALTKQFIGDALVGTAGYMGFDALNSAVTGKTFKQNVADGLGEIGLEKVPYSIREGIGSFINPGGWLTWGGGSQFANYLYNRGTKLVGNIANKFTTNKNSLFKIAPETRLARAMNKNINQGIQSGQYWHGSPNRHVTQFKVGKDGGIYFTQNRDAAKQYTGTFGTGKVYNADLDLGNKTITIDSGGAAWTKIPENKVAEAFNLTPQQVHDIIGSYNLSETPWHYGFTQMFGYKPKNNYYAIDQVVKLGKDQGISSLIIKNAKDNGKRLFSRTMPYDQTVVYNPGQIILGGQTLPNLQQYGIWQNFNNGQIPETYTLWHKSGGSIKIEKKNIGSFTRYCKGKVTEECIRKGKNSSNPTTRKRANFAWVARHKFKHEEGGTINYLNYSH